MRVADRHEAVLWTGRIAVRCVLRSGERRRSHRHGDAAVVEDPRVPGTGVGPDLDLAPSQLRGGRRRPRCACRCPETSATLPSRFHTRSATSASSGCQTSSTPSAPRPVAASQRIRARAAVMGSGSMSRSTSRKWFPRACHFERRTRPRVAERSPVRLLEERDQRACDLERPRHRRPTRRAGAPASAHPARS